MNEIATIQELSIFWKEIPENEKNRAEMLINMALNILRGKMAKIGVILDDKVEDDEIFKSNVKWVVFEAVKRALQTPQDTPPVNSYSQSAGVYSENFTYTNPAGDLWFKKSELQILGIGGNQRLKSTNMYQGE